MGVMESDTFTPAVYEPIVYETDFDAHRRAAGRQVIPIDPTPLRPVEAAADTSQDVSGTNPAVDEPAPEPAPEAAPEMDAAACQTLADRLLGQGKPGEAESFYRAAITLDPERPSCWANLGLAMLHCERPEDAARCAREALRLDPDNADAMNTIGIAMHALNALPEAENHFRGVLRLAPDHANATLNLGVIRQCLGYLTEAERLYRLARVLGVDEARACNNLALALAEMDRLLEAEAACREALTARPGYLEASVNLGMILLMRGKMAEAWPHYEARWRVAPLSEQSQLPPETRWTGEQDLEGKTILLLAEQGLGDTVQFCRYAPMVAKLGAKVILAVPASLARLLKTVAGVNQIVSQDDPLPGFDWFCPLLSLPMVFGTTEATIPARVPYLEADPHEIVTFDVALADVPGLRIGLVWAGERRAGQPRAAAIDQRRSMRLADMAPLAELPGCAFVSLQLGPPAKQAADAPFPLLDLTDRLTDFAATAALIEALDLVITVDTAVAHVAGALGKPVWLLNRYDGCWRWPRDRDDSAWYPTMRLFRQRTPGDWAGVMRRVAAALPGFQTFG
jgi:tetratricopeptide (TPR) repeat protein